MITFLWLFLLSVTLAVLVAEIRRRAAYDRAAVERAEARFQALVESSHDIYFRSDLDGRMVAVSPSVRAITGFGPEELLGQKTPPLCLDPADSEIFTREVMRAGTVRGYECNLRKKGGGSIIVSATAKIVTGPNGQPVATEGVLRDITRERRGDEVLRRRLELEKTLADVSALFAGPADADEAINEALRKLGSPIRAGRARLWQFSPDKATISTTHEWCAAGVEPQIDKGQGIPSQRFSWLAGQVQRGEPVQIDNLAQMPAEARAEQEEFQREKIR